MNSIYNLKALADRMASQMFHIVYYDHCSDSIRYNIHKLNMMVANSYDIYIDKITVRGSNELLTAVDDLGFMLNRKNMRKGRDLLYSLATKYQCELDPYILLSTYNGERGWFHFKKDF